jgi:hypothetical protein
MRDVIFICLRVLLLCGSASDGEGEGYASGVLHVNTSTKKRKEKNMVSKIPSAKARKTP